MSHHLAVVALTALLGFTPTPPARKVGKDVDLAKPSPMLTVRLARRCGPNAPCLQPRVIKWMTHETTRIWARLGVHITWSGFEGNAARHSPVNLIVLVEESGEPPPALASHRTVLAAVNHPATPRVVSVARVWVAPTRRLMAPLQMHGRRLHTLPGAWEQRVLARALGRTLAHEIGHYVLGTADHRREGLMRASFAPAEWLDANGDTHYGLNAFDLASVRSRVGAEGTTLDQPANKWTGKQASTR